MFWANFLHFYQPPTQKKQWVDRITNEAYRRILAELVKEPQAKVTLNISAILVELWDKFGHRDVIEGYRKLLERGQIELTGSAKYHPLLPRLPREEIVRQIKLSQATLKSYFGDACKPKGFFPPEMAYDRKVAEVVGEMGYEWIIVDEYSYAPELDVVDHHKIYEVDGVNSSKSGEPLKIFFRQRSMSYKVLSGQLGTVDLFLRELGDRLKGKEYLLTAMDGETFGHHRPGMEKLLFELYQASEIKPILISDLSGVFKEREAVATRPATWALMQQDLEQNVPFARWDDPGNKIHKMQWELTEMAVNVVRSSKYHVPSTMVNGKSEDGKSERGKKKLSVEQKGWLKTRELLDRALHSDQYWWACARPWWSLEMIERGAYELKETVLATPDVSEVDKRRAQDLYFKILTTGFEWQRTGKVEALARKEDETMRMLADRGVVDLPKKEIRKMIATIQKELDQVAMNQEYERAVQLRDRIKELEGYMKGEGGS
jgi:hypothetical protein